jgi:outer membrane protein assembly factor BamB
MRRGAVAGCMRCGLLLAALAAPPGPAARAADWPQWRGPDRSGCSAETGLLKAWPSGGPRRAWIAAGLGAGYASATVADGRIYTTGSIDKKGFLQAFDLDGRHIWKREYGPEWTGTNPGSRSTPTVLDGRLYAMSAYGRLVCADARAGDLIWQVDILERFRAQNTTWGLAESPLVVGDAVICTPGGPDASVVALDRSTGKTLWTSRGLGERAASCSPAFVQAAGRRVIVTSLLRSSVGIDAADGKVLWTYDSTDAGHLEDAVNPNTPVSGGGGLLVPSLRERGAGKLALAPDGASVREVWTQQKAISHIGGMLLVDGSVYLASGTRWMCVDWETGEVRYQAPGVGKGAAIYADGFLYCYGERGRVALVKASPGGHEIAGSFDVDQGSGEHFAHPSLAHGRLYIRHGDALLAYEVRDGAR